jgi:hypothetical protein
LTAIRSRSGWASLRYAASPETTLSIGVGMDDPNDDDLAANMRSRNETQFISVSHRITPNFILGSQLSRWRTDYNGSSKTKIS